MVIIRVKMLFTYTDLVNKPKKQQNNPFERILFYCIN